MIKIYNGQVGNEKVYISIYFNEALFLIIHFLV